MAKIRTAKEPIRLREKKLLNGDISLYLDIYINGKRRYEFLKLYLVREVTKTDKEQNKQTLLLANSIKAKRQIEIQNNEYGFRNNFKAGTNLFEYIKSLETKKKSSNTQENWASCLVQLSRYCLKTTTLRDVDEKFIQGFKDYLDNDATYAKGKDKLSQNTKNVYFGKFASAIRQAYNDELIASDPSKKVKNFKIIDPKRIYLTLDELRKLSKTDCARDVLKRAFLFGCLTGLRKSDILSLRWEDVHRFREYTRIIFRQEKTDSQEYLDINPQAVEFMGEQGKPNELVFDEFYYNAHTSIMLQRWCLAAGINKEITFHSSRHTFAVLMLDLGADIYTTSKLLGHKDLKSTQVYAKVLDKNKQAAINLIPKI